MAKEAGCELYLPDRPEIKLSMLSQSQLSVLAGLEGFAHTSATSGELRELVWQRTNSTSCVQWREEAVKVQLFEQIKLACSVSVYVAHSSLTAGCCSSEIRWLSLLALGQVVHPWW